MRAPMGDVLGRGESVAHRHPAVHWQRLPDAGHVVRPGAKLLRKLHFPAHHLHHGRSTVWHGSQGHQDAARGGGKNRQPRRVGEDFHGAQSHGRRGKPDGFHPNNERHVGHYGDGRVGQEDEQFAHACETEIGGKGGPGRCGTVASAPSERGSDSHGGGCRWWWWWASAQSTAHRSAGGPLPLHLAPSSQADGRDEHALDGRGRRSDATARTGDCWGGGSRPQRARGAERARSRAGEIDPHAATSHGAQCRNDRYAPQQQRCGRRRRCGWGRLSQLPQLRRRGCDPWRR